MANRYWVGGTAKWDSSAGTKWALTDGGAGGQAVPTSADDVFFTAASGAVTVSLGGTICNCLSFDTTGFTGTIKRDTLDSPSFNVYGNFNLAAATTFTFQNATSFRATDSRNITLNGHQLPYQAIFNGVGGSWTFQDNFACVSTFNLAAGTINSNNKNFAVGSLISGATATRVLNMGTGTWSIGPGAASTITLADATGLTVNASSATIHLYTNVATNVTALFGTHTFFNLIVEKIVSGTFSVIFGDGGSTFNKITLIATDASGLFINFTVGATITAATWERDIGTNTITINSSDGTNAATVAKTGSGIAIFHNMNIAHSTATPVNTFYAGSTSTDSGGNTNWLFFDPSNMFLVL
jgi:hypothetical protein